MRTPFLIIWALILFSSCQNSKSAPPLEIDKSLLSSGTWNMDVLISEDKSIPFKFEVLSDSCIHIVNHSERIEIKDISYFGDSIHFAMPRFDSEFVGKIEDSNKISGTWYNKLRGDYSIPFVAEYINEETHHDIPNGKQSKYKVTFSPDSDEDMYQAIGLFNINADKSTGTFITETGDYRFLEGIINNDQLRLSCFDGSHLFLFEATMDGENIVDGTFYSGKHWQEPWIGEKDVKFELSDPDSLTFLKEGYSSLNFTCLNEKEENIAFSNEDYLNKVTIVQIFGSWCPNCHDENVYYSGLYDSYNKQGLQIIPVAFETGDTFDTQKSYVVKQFEEIGIEYPFYIGGNPRKSEASEKFPMLNKIISFPTSIFIDKKGEVRRIHTGFYGPGTGAYYSDYISETDAFVKKLISE